MRVSDNHDTDNWAESGKAAVVCAVVAIMLAGFSGSFIERFGDLLLGQVVNEPSLVIQIIASIIAGIFGFVGHHTITKRGKSNDSQGSK